MGERHNGLFQIRLLGPVTLHTPDGAADLGPPQQRLLVAALAAEPGGPVTPETIIDRLWDAAPNGARRTLHVLVTRVRGLLRRADPDGRAIALHRRDGCYLLDVQPDRVDVARFRALARTARETGRSAADRHDLLSEAVGLWRGEPLAGLPGRWATRTREAWRQEHLQAMADWGHAAIDAGRPEVVVAPLTALAAEYPLTESLTAGLMSALWAAGRPADALAQYARIRRRLADEIGSEPGEHLHGVYLSILRGDGTPARDRVVAGAAVDDRRPVPRQLPLDVPGFTGRAAELAQLDAALDRAANAGAVGVSVVTGMAGVGKTAMVLHWAHGVADRFPGGQLYVNLRGFDAVEMVVDPNDALRGFLEALGVPDSDIPAGPDARARQLRSLLADRRTLLILDNARDSAQIRPLLPGTGASVVVVTSRDRLSGLVVEVAAAVTCLDVLSDDEAAALLAGRLGPGRLTSEPVAAAEIIAATARLPLALAIAAAQATARPTFPLAVLAAELRDPGNRLQALAEGDLRHVFSWSCRALSEDAATLFRHLGLHPGPDITAEAAAALAGVPTRTVVRWLAELTRQHLLIETVPGRYGFHDLVGEYARELAADLAGGVVARARLLEFYTLHALAAAHVFAQHDFPRLADAEPAETARFTEETGHRWLVAEERNLLAACRYAAAHGPYEAAWRIADAMGGYAHVRQDHALWEQLVRAAQRAGDAVGDRRVAAFVAYHSAAITDARRQYTRAVTEYAKALELCRAAWPEAAVTTLNMMAALNHQLGSPRQAHDQLIDALRLSRESGQRFEEAKILVHLGCVATDRGRQDEAMSAFEECLRLFEHERSQLGRAIALVNIAYVRLMRGEPEVAADDAREAVAIGTHTGLIRIQVVGHTLLSAAQRRLGRFDAAGNHIAEAFKLARDGPDLQALGRTHQEAGLLHDALGELELAVEHYRTAYRTAVDLPSLHDVIRFSMHVTLAEHRLGRLATSVAAEQLRDARRRAAEVGFLALEGLAHRAIAELMYGCGDNDAAAAHARQAALIPATAGSWDIPGKARRRPEGDDAGPWT